ncbi:carboxypeptidase regulatory-like domain-containing protein [Lacinutrix venerupis]|uniref:TonB-dependent receptor n=1 Tax=Lacinutrix venerupis TaxID=1486034 RepID=A0AAC9LP44_9FLAO|nr:carboxypeptidase-like regulatory domain-containing protein [Lacinutrix venerupis]APY01115.1 TonB-dependent receptor [Lacinutrix venerupis]
MKYIFTLLLLFVANTIIAQVKFEGVVKDAEGEALEFANVIAINKESKVLESYAVTNEAGRYKLNLGKNTTYTIQVSYIGYKNFEQEITTKEESINQNFDLLIDNSLDEVELVYEMPVTISGDTITYNADSFKNGTERKLGDVLEKMPGVEVTDEGEIEVEGKTVGKVMVDGKDFFDGDSKLATKNIPANAIDKVQVLKNYSNNSQLSGVTNNQDNIAINIKLKEGKKNFWFGTVTAGVGDSPDGGLYLAQPKLFYYSPEKSINFIGDINNIGELALSRRDIFNFGGGFQQPSQQSGTNINLGSNDLGFRQLQNNQAKDINTKFGAANFSYSPKSSLELSGFAIFASSRIDLQENSSVLYTNNDLNIPDEYTQSNTEQKSDLGLLKFSTTYKPNANNQLDYDIIGRISKDEQINGTYSTVVGGINQLEDTDPYKINQNLNYYYTLDDSNIFALSIQHLLQDEDPFYNALLENDPTNNDNGFDPDNPENDEDSYDGTAEDIGLDRSQQYYSVNQEKFVKTNQLDAKLDYWNILNKKSDINFTVGTIYSNQQFDSNIFQTLDDGTDVDTNSNITGVSDVNDIKYTFSDVYLGMHYRYKTGKFTISPGLSAHAYGVKNDQFNTVTTNNFFRLLPDLNVRVQLKSSENLNLSYKMQTQFTDVNQFARGLVLNNYNSTFVGNPSLENSLSHNINLSYFSFNMFNYTNVFAFLNYSKNIDNIRTESIFQPGSVIRSSTPFNSDLADETFTASGRFQRRFGKLQASIRGNFNFSKYNQFINNLLSVNKSFTQTYTPSIRSNFREAPNFELSYRYSLSDNDQGDRTTKIITNSPSIEFDALIFKKFTFATDYGYTRQTLEGNTNSFGLWNANLMYRKTNESKWEYEIKATNILDVSSKLTNSVGGFSVSTSEYFIQPRFLTFRAIYNL